MCYYLGRTRQACESRERAVAEQEEKEFQKSQEQERCDEHGLEPDEQTPKAAA
jgi:hypothetical protein